jgi:hypothetical protein
VENDEENRNFLSEAYSPEHGRCSHDRMSQIGRAHILQLVSLVVSVARAAVLSRTAPRGPQAPGPAL